MLSVRGLTRSGLAPVDFDLAAGECVALMGPSGAGKTLLLRAIADLDPNVGSVSLDGAARASMAAPVWRSQVRYLAAESGWWADRVGDHFDDKNAANGLAHELNLSSDVWEWPVARLSTGEKQRLALIRTVIGAPRVLLLDEPSSGLDSEAAAQTEALLLRQRERGAALVVATHDLDQARRLARRRLYVEPGGVVREEAL